MIDSALERFFVDLENRNLRQVNPQQELHMYTSFFRVWQDNPELVAVLNRIDFDRVLS